MPLNTSEIDILKRFGENIRRIRLEKEWSMEFLANEAGVELSQIYRIEKGKINPKLTTIILLSKKLDVDFSELLNSLKV
ncbi:helix-turn-helix domain-containing protein [Pedobacter borealis]|uniref:helix-turn-helix domain-containing protein n=1 Tax=Pedobacter borealis TaxID=475254 RepID=UPI000492F72A|nr:helix-turn-helix transcriptional regulator [Pedobacter borealis]